MHFGGSVHWPLVVQATSDAPSLSCPETQLYAMVVPKSADMLAVHVLTPLVITGGAPQSMTAVDKSKCLTT